MALKTSQYPEVTLLNAEKVQSATTFRALPDVVGFANKKLTFGC
jgi:hypothetical protein